jgi:hypothetical protein
VVYLLKVILLVHLTFVGKEGRSRDSLPSLICHQQQDDSGIYCPSSDYSPDINLTTGERERERNEQKVSEQKKSI